MRANAWGTLMIVLLGASLGACTGNDTGGPDNHRPVISSVTVFPTVIGLTDSAAVTCFASDPDDDVLVYDWITDGRLTIQGALPGTHFLYNTHTPRRVFYPEYITGPVDTGWVQCYARDGRGMSANRIVNIIVRR